MENQNFINQDTLVLVYYIGIRQLNPQKAQELLFKYMTLFSETEDVLKHHKSNFKQYFIPDTSHNNVFVACVNPKFISTAEYSEINKLLDEARLKINDFLDGATVDNKVKTAKFEEDLKNFEIEFARIKNS
jgi:hypothetical protein